MRIELEEICQSVGERQVLEHVSIAVDSGQCLAVSGRSGSGKSLLFSIVCGIFMPQKGRVLVDGQSFFQMSEREYLHFRKYLGVIFQVPALISNLSLKENLILPLNQHCPDVSCEDKQAQVRTICHEFELLDYLDKRTDQLSAGQACLAGLARALLIEPQCLVWDAPMAEIDLKWIEHVQNRMCHLKRGGTTMILFTNRARLIEKMADIRLDLTTGQVS